MMQKIVCVRDAKVRGRRYCNVCSWRWRCKELGELDTWKDRSVEAKEKKVET